MRRASGESTWSVTPIKATPSQRYKGWRTIRYGPSVTNRLASAKMLKDLPSHRSTTKESEVPTRINVVDTSDQTGPNSAFGSKASVVHKNVPSKPEIRGS